MAATLADLLEARHSCRAFLDRPVPRETIAAVLQTAQRTGSWCNSQAWQVSVASGAATERLRQALLAAAPEDRASDFPFPERYTGAYQQRRRECGWQLYEAVSVARDDREAAARQARENFRLFGAPHVAVLTSDAGLGTYGAVDVGGYVQVLLLALQAHGIQSIAQAALAGYSTLVKRVLGIPPERLMVCAVSFGYENAEHPANRFRTGRASLDEVVDWIES